MRIGTERKVNIMTLKMKEMTFQAQQFKEVYQRNRLQTQTTAKYNCLVGMMSAIFSTFVKLFFSAEIKFSLL